MTQRRQRECPQLQAALVYAEMGWRVLTVWGVTEDGRCRCPRGRLGRFCETPGKHPVGSEWTKRATTNARKIKAWKWDMANVGIATGIDSGLIVLDIDDKYGGSQSIIRLQETLGKLPLTMKVRTGNGWHLYFRHPGGRVRTTAGCLADGVDVRGDGGQVVAPPSRHKSGAGYEWTPGRGVDDGRLESLPDGWIQALQDTCYIDNTDGQCYTDHIDSAGQHRQHKTTQDNSDNPRQLPDRPTGRARPNIDPAENPPRPGRPEPLPPVGNLLELPAVEFVQWAITRTIPYGPSQRHRQVFAFARFLKAHPEVSTWGPSKLWSAAQRWYAAAADKIGADAIEASCEENAEDFLEGWDMVHTPAIGVVELAFSAANDAEPPKFAERFREDHVKRLLTACREMQRLAGEGKPWFLSTRQVCRLMPEIKKPMAAFRLLRLFERFEILKVVQRGSPRGRRATSYLYLPPLDE